MIQCIYSKCMYCSYDSHVSDIEILVSVVTCQYTKSLQKVLLILCISSTTQFTVSNHKVHQNSYKITLKHHVHGSPNSRIHKIQYIQRYRPILAHCAISPYNLNQFGFHNMPNLSRPWICLLLCLQSIPCTLSLHYRHSVGAKY